MPIVKVDKDGKQLLGVRLYAAHRKREGLKSASPSSIQKALADGVIARTCPKHERCPQTCIDGGFDPVIADADFATFRRESHHSQKTDLPKDSEYAEARKVRELYESRIKRLEFEERIGALVPRSEMKVAVFALYRRLRDAVIAVPRRTSPRIATESDPRVIRQLLEDELRDALSGTFDGDNLHGQED